MFYKAIQSVQMGKSTPEEALENMEKQFMLVFFVLTQKYLMKMSMEGIKQA